MRPRDGRLVRPLLGITRAQTTAWCEERGLAWVDDATNEGDAYARNRVRRALVPALESIHPAAVANVLRTAALLRDEAAVLDELVEAQLTREPGTNGGGPTIELERLAGLPPALRRLVVQRLADEVAGRPVAGAARHADEVAALRRTGTAMLDLGSGVRAVVERGVLRAERGP
jgi:tRNA(Ile)-lysidine synthase